MLLAWQSHSQFNNSVTWKCSCSCCSKCPCSFLTRSMLICSTEPIFYQCELTHTTSMFSGNFASLIDLLQQFVHRRQAPTIVWKLFGHSLRNLAALYLFSRCKTLIRTLYFSIKAIIINKMACSATDDIVKITVIGGCLEAFTFD